MDIGKAFTFFKDDQKWIEKVGIGLAMVLLGFLILPTIILSGYGIRLLQNVRDGHSEPLPEWNDWSGDLVRGFKLWVIQILWALPILLLSVPTSIGAAITDQGGFGEFFGMTLLVCGMCLTLLYGLFVALASPGYTIAFARDERINSGVQMTAIWHWTRENLGQVIIATLVIIAGAFIIVALAGIIGVVLCLVGLALTIPLASVIIIFFQNHLYGQLAYEHPFQPSGRASHVPPPPSPDLPPAIVPGSEIVADEPETPVTDQAIDAGDDVAATVAEMQAAMASDVETAHTVDPEVGDPLDTVREEEIDAQAGTYAATSMANDEPMVTSQGWGEEASVTDGQDAAEADMDHEAGDQDEHRSSAGS